jgi:hypothetical protein
MKKIGFILFCLIISITSNSQNRIDSLNFVISEIISYKSATRFFEEENSIIDRDSIQTIHQEKIIQYSNQQILETILDTTNSLDLKYYCAQALVSYPSKKISDAFFNILLDTNSYYELDVENSCLVYTTNLTAVPYGRAWHILEDTDSTTSIKNNLEKELLEMDSIWIFFKYKATNPYDDEGEFYQLANKRNLKNRNLVVSKWILKDYFDTKINLLENDTYGNNCSYGGFGPELRYQLERTLDIDDSTNLKFEIEKRLYFNNLWLNSKYTVIRVYGAEALIRLQNNGVKLTEEQINMISKLKEQKKKIKTCHGCIYGDRIRVKNALKPFNLN